ncbi:hypothetical protein M426DRAFT_55928 [Hypoxylon sp. CI-4A]|nr:hypothetical protein M426DRAFT_55928 [Hypoxylon sp. CI-4A]
MVADLSSRLNDASTQNPVSPLPNLGETESEREGGGKGELNPEHEGFDIRKWLQLFTKGLEDQGHKGLRTGVVFKTLSISGSGEPVQFQQTVTDLLLQPLQLAKLFTRERKQRKILHNFNGLVNSGELLLVLGRPGSGCSTLLKALTGELQNLHVHDKSVIHYNGIPQKNMINEFKGELAYNQEVDKHFPQLTVGQTLEFAAACRAPTSQIHGMSRKEFSQRVVRIIMAVCGLSHTYDTRVGNDFVRGVSGGERKRVSIAEMMLAGSSISAWDNSTRGLDSATALKFVQSLRLASDLGGSANAVAIYQASQAIYNEFDKVTVLYEGRQIYFGPANEAKAFFEEQGWHCPPRQTTGDFLTAITNPGERTPQAGMEDKVPRTAEEFQQRWRNSAEFQALHREIAQYQRKSRIIQSAALMTDLRSAKNFMQARHVRPKSPYTISLPMQIRLTTRRAYQRMWNDRSATVAQVVINVVCALIVGSVFYGTSDRTDSFQARGSVLFLAVLINALSALAEITTLYAQRPIVEKHASYAFYHPATEAMATVVAEIPIKLLLAIAFNIVLYFLSGLRREHGPFFLYLLVSFVVTFVMSAIFKATAAITKTPSQAMSVAGILVLILAIYTGFVVAVPQMGAWFGWLRWLNPVYYSFEMMVANEFHNKEFTCASFIPPYTPTEGPGTFICSAVGAIAGNLTVSGDDFIRDSYRYSYSHVWRNLGILIGFLIFFMAVYVGATEFNASASSSAMVLIFRRKRGLFGSKSEKNVADSKSSSDSLITDMGLISQSNMKGIEPQKDMFTWRDVVYDINVAGENRRLLDNVAGWAKPGTLTALMGVSGAGKTTLLDVLAQRTTMGVITGDMLVNGKPLPRSFQRNTGYVQQQDLHLETATVRESLRFSALLRQPKNVRKAEKYAFVEEVITMLNMEDFADAIVGVPGEGLNVEQRKLLSIGVELAAKPRLLLFLDEPTSGLDSQSSWAICAFLRKLADSGQAVLCTIHQPSALLFQQFDRLLFLARGGKTIYFGNIGENSRTMLDYFESRGARPCDDQENPAEYMLEIVNERGEEWHSMWNSSEERAAVNAEIDRIHAERAHQTSSDSESSDNEGEFAATFFTQLQVVTHRIFQQYWRMPGYVGAKWGLATAAGIFIGFSFWKAQATQAGMQNVIYGVFMIVTLFTPFVQQIQPLFTTQRSLYEVRERPSKVYSWQSFLIANTIAELPYQIVAALIIYASVYYPIIGIQSSDRQGLVLLFILQFFIYVGTFAHMTVAALPNAETAGALVTLLTLMSMIFCGVFQAPAALPGFWIFMYRASPFTYWIGGIVGTQLHDRAVACSAEETSIFNPPAGQTCFEYMDTFLQTALGKQGQLQNGNDTSDCRYCSLRVADQYLAPTGVEYSERWRNFGIFWAYIVFNIFATVLTYYIFRVVRWRKQ